MKLIKNRVFIAIACCVISFLLVMIAINQIDAQNETITVLTITNTIRKGDIIDADSLGSITVGKQGFPADYAVNKEDIIEQYALADLYPGDFILKSKVSPVLSNSEAKLLKLDGERVAISVLIKDFARGLSDKIVGGDIVSCVITSDTSTDIPEQLTYVEVVATTAPSGADKDNSSDSTQENLATATLLVTPEQAIMLADANLNSDIHLALVYRGDEESSQQFLDRQNEVLASLSPTLPPEYTEDVA